MLDRINASFRDLGEALIEAPVFLFQLVVALIIAALTDQNTAPIAMAGVAIGFALGVWPALAISLGLYATVAAIYGVAEQINFNARVIRDNNPNDAIRSIAHAIRNFTKS